LKCLGVYDSRYIKEINADLDWSSSSDSVSIDEKGTVSALSKGNAEIKAKYKGRISNAVEITVLDKIDATTENALKKELSH